MNLITVIPITRQKVAPTLAYFTASEVPVGAVVSVPLRSKTIHAIVTDTRPVEDLKAEIRSAPFEIRKLGKVKADAFFPSSFMQAAAELAEYYATATGNIIRAMVSEAILDSANKIAPPLPLQASFITAATPAPDETYAVQGDDADRLSAWRSLIRQEFARKRSVAIYAPTAEDVRSIYESLEKGIEGYIFMLHGGLSKKRLIETWGSAADTDHPVVIVAAGSFPVLPRADIDTIVIERENGRGWISERMPYIDLRHALETVHRRAKRTVHLADALLSIRSLHRLDEHDIAEGSPFKWRSISRAADALIDMKHEPVRGAAQPEKAGFRVLSPELEGLIARNIEDNAHMFIMAVRRGLATATVCDDCDAVIVCKSCSAPVVLHASANGANFFMCHKCGERMDADTQCANCGGWRLNPLGVGTDRVAQAVKERFPKADIIRLDADLAKTAKEMAEAMKRFMAKPGSILVGTEAALLRLPEPVEHVAVASLDSLFALPDYRITEKIMYAIVRLRAAADRTVLIQTRRPEEAVFGYGLKGNLSDFYRSVLAERKQFSYPPFSTLIKITLEGKKADIAKKMGELQSAMSPRELEVFPAFTSTVRGVSVIHGLIRLPEHDWPDGELVRFLRSLPPEVIIKIDPESLL
ncbi:MAG: hypothetical protein KGI49_00205 [Patescibacteria group bacterium]|nr:hypothetical protein [Patescibacteria group bacterium]